MTHLLIDDRWTEGGIGRYARAIQQRLSPSIDTEGLNKVFRIADPLTPIKLGLIIRHRQPDVFWSPGFMPPLRSSAPFIFTLHDLIHVHQATRLQALYYEMIIRPLARRAFRVATVSEFSRSEIIQWTGLSEDRVVLIPNGVSSEFTPGGEKYDPGYPYLFYVGARKSHKNLDAMLRAYALSGISKYCRLLLSGNTSNALQSLAVELGISEQVCFAGFIPENQLPSYYRGAQALVMISTYEGFGLPVLEAMASGIPVLCSNTTSLKELGGDAVLAVNPLNLEEIANAMRDILEDTRLRSAQIARGLLRVQKFQWEHSALALSELIMQAAQQNERKQR